MILTTYSLGHVFDNVDDELFPMAGLRSPGEAIRANFGHQPFKYDIESHVHIQRNAQWSKIQSTPFAWSPSDKTFETETAPAPTADTRKQREDETREAIERLVMDYLSHRGYAGTAEAFRLGLAARASASALNAASIASTRPSGSSSSMEVSLPSPSESKALSISSGADILARQRITAALLSGDVDYALETMGDRYPEALSDNGGWLLFRLRCRKFVELVLEAAVALKIARKVEAAEAAARDKGKGTSTSAGFANAHAHAPAPSAPVPMGHSPSHPLGPDVVPHNVDDEEENDSDEHAMDVDDDDETEDEADYRAVQDHLLQTPQSSPPRVATSHPRSPFTLTTSSTLASSAYTKPNNSLAISRPLIPISTSSSSPSNTPPSTSPLANMFPVSAASNTNNNASNGASNSNNGHPAPPSTPAPTSPSAYLHAHLFPQRTPPRGLITAPPPSSSNPSSTSGISSAAQAALEHIFAYGRQLDADYGADERAHVQMLFHRTSSLVAYENPLEAGGDVSRLAGQEAREELARDVNEGILRELSLSSTWGYPCGV